MLPIVFNSNRVALLYLLLVYLLLFSAEIFKAPLKAFFVTMLFVLTLAIVSWSYMSSVFQGRHLAWLAGIRVSDDRKKLCGGPRLRTLPTESLDRSDVLGPRTPR